jgi:hypothetical protein
MKLRVELNGTDTNPYHAMCLTQSPFPQIAKYEYAALCLHLQALGGDPIPNEQYIRNHLKGWSKEFVDLCCNRFKKGEYIVFEVEFAE